MRVFLWLLLLGFVAGAAWFHLGARTSYSAYSAEQLEQMRAELTRSAAAKEFDEIDARVAISFIDDEERRRKLAWALTLSAVLFGFMALQPFRGTRSRRTDEELRLARAIGATPSPGESRRVAAELLGVTTNAPPSVVEAAFHAQLSSRKESLAASMPPHLRKLVEGQCEELKKARDLLISTHRAPAHTASA